MNLKKQTIFFDVMDINMLGLEISATILGLTQGVLVLLNKRSNWIFYIAQMLCLIFFALANKLHGDMTNSIIYLILGIVGWFMWSKKNSLAITTCSWVERFIYVGVMLLGTFLLSAALKKHPRPVAANGCIYNHIFFCCYLLYVAQNDRYMDNLVYK